jgi:hypothetical protein
MDEIQINGEYNKSERMDIGGIHTKVMIVTVVNGLDRESETEASMRRNLKCLGRVEMSERNGRSQNFSIVEEK